MRKVIRANGKCPLCGSEASVLFLTTECTNIGCSNHKDGIVTKEEYDLLESSPVAESDTCCERTLFEDDCDDCDDCCDDCDGCESDEDERKD